MTQPARPELVASDLDGTLIARDNELSPRVASAVAAVIDAGIPVVPVSGRPWQWVLDLAREHRFGPWLVASNGAAIVDVETGVVEHNGLADGAVLGLMERIRTAVPGVNFAVDLVDRLAYEDGFHDPGYRGPEAPSDLVPLVEEGVIKLIARQEGLPSAELVARLDHDVLHGVGVAHGGWGEWVEIVATGVSKASGLEVVAGRMGIDPVDILALGDEWNDIPMFEWVGDAVAMGQSPDRVKAAAHRVAPAADDDGAAVVLERLLTQTR